jgi:hypothetical protein
MAFRKLERLVFKVKGYALFIKSKKKKDTQINVPSVFAL